jgi:putative sterol carrier protein
VTGSESEPFASLGRGENLPLIKGARGVMRVDLVDGERTERWFITIEGGTVDVSRRNRAADCVLRADRKLFRRMAAGEENAFAAVLRGAVTVEGDPKLLVLFQRLLPGASSSRPATAGNHG